MEDKRPDIFGDARLSWMQSLINFNVDDLDTVRRSHLINLNLKIDGRDYG